MQRAGVVPWPEEAQACYVAEGYWRGKPLGDLVWQWADNFGDRIAVVDGQRRLSYLELAVEADALADELAGLGFKDGDNILVQLPNCWELVVLLLACFRLGVAPVMMLPAHREYELAGVGRHTSVAAIAVPDIARGYDHQALAAQVAGGLDWPCRILVAGDNVRDGNVDLRSLTVPTGDVVARRRRLDAMAPDAGDVALFLLSGGTTGLSKVISRTHNDYEYNARASAAVCGFGPDTVYLVALPAGHNFPLGSPGLLGTLMMGGRVVMVRTPSPRSAFPVIERERVTTVSLVPAVAQRWTTAAEQQQQPDLSSLRLVQVGGSLFAPEHARRARQAFGCWVQQCFGMAEGLLNYTRFDDDSEVTATTQGRPTSPHDEIRIVDDAGNPVPPGTAGELLTRGPYTPRGYFNAPEHNARAFTPDGWYRTGDIVRLHPGGNFIVAGRNKDVINRGGEKVAADELERLVQLLPQVAEAAAVPYPDPELGERVCLCTVLRPGATLTLADVVELFTARSVAAYKIPERLEVVSTMPYTPVGKIDKKALRALVTSGALVTAEGSART